MARSEYGISCDAECERDNDVLTDDDLVQQVRGWAVFFKIWREACPGILGIFKLAGVNIPISFNGSFKLNECNKQIVSVPPGKYLHYDVQKGLESSDDISIDIGIDGLPLFKSSSTQL